MAARVDTSFFRTLTWLTLHRSANDFPWADEATYIWFVGGATPRRLAVTDHRRDAIGMKYVYAVASRRAGGVSVGINLSPNNACNFRCIYCQVPGLSRGSSPPVELPVLAEELGDLLDRIEHGSFLERSVDRAHRRLVDVAFSGNGEPTSSPFFADAVHCVAEQLEARGQSPGLPIVLITNGTLLGRPQVLRGLDRMARAGGRVWFKLDSVTREGFRHINDTPLDPVAQLERLRSTARRLPTRIQTCLLSWDGRLPPREEREAYLQVLLELRGEGVPLEGVTLYSIARPSQQPEAARLERLSETELETWAEPIRRLGYHVQVRP